MGHPDSPRRPEQRSCLSTLVWAVVALAAVLVVTVLVASWAYRRSVDRRLETAIAEADRLDPNWRLEQLDASRPEIPEGENSAELLRDVLDEMPVDWPGESASGLFDLVDAPPPNQDLRDEEARAIQEELESLESAVNLARTLVDAGPGRFEVDRAVNPLATLLPHVQQSRGIVRLLRLDAALRADGGDIDGAIESTRAMLGVSRALGDDPYFISQLVRMALEGVAVETSTRVLAQGEASDAALAALQEDLAEESAEPLLLYALRGERASMDDLYRKLGDGTLTFNDLASSIMGGPTGRFPPGMAAFAASNRALSLSFLNRAVEIAKQPLPEQHALWKQYQADTRPPQGLFSKLSQALTWLMLPAVESVGRAYLRTRAQLNAEVALLACERYRMAVGDWPDDPEQQLRPYLPGGSMPIDPFTGEPIRVVLLDDGIAAYAVGPDLKDDGGTFDPRNWDGDGSDIGSRLWDPEGRRQPPPPSSSPDDLPGDPEIDN